MADRLVFLGTGTGVPDGHRLPTALLLEVDRRAWLVDLGPGVLRAAVRHLGLTGLRRILLTHFHLDHTADLATLFFALKNTRRRPRHLEIYGPPGLGRFLETLLHPWNLPLEIPGMSLTLHEVSPGTVLEAGLLRITVFATLHTEESQGYRFQHPTFSLAYTGDTGYDPALAVALEGVDLLVTEVSYLRPVRGHLSPLEAALLARAAGARHLAVVHRYPDQPESALRAQMEAWIPKTLRVWFPKDGEVWPLRRLRESGV